MILSVVPMVMALVSAAEPPSFTPPHATSEVNAATEATAAMIFLYFTIESPLFACCGTQLPQQSAFTIDGLCYLHVSVLWVSMPFLGAIHRKP